ncbi:hypothetical protein AAF712_007284 [Marasmius tenuissimus]|uniref:Amine oxidase domain-containing protein n=1 Tax=Marasmius tenuissimus TaxID=585030 RepID=A0ABR2ZXW9_9AGAR
MPRKVKVAVVGSGLAGLTAAYSLTANSKQPSTRESNTEGQGGEDVEVDFEVHIFEKSSTLGMDSSSISIPVPGEEQEWRVDVPMRSFQGGYYPQLIALYEHLGVKFRTSDYSYSFSLLSPASHAETRRMTTSMIYNGRSGLAGVSMPARMRAATRSSIERAWAFVVFAFMAIQLLVCYLRLRLLSTPMFRFRDTPTMDYTTWAKRTLPTGFLAQMTGFDIAWIEFTQDVLIPLFSAVCTCPLEDVQQHPVEEFLDYIWLTLGTHHYVAKNGVRDVVSRLSSHISDSNIHLCSAISSLRPDASDPSLVSIHCASATGEKVYSGFHHIILATQANRAIPILESYVTSLTSNPSDDHDRRYHQQLIQRQINCLRKFKYISSLVINHTDGSLVPDDPRDRRDLNLISPDPLSFPSQFQSYSEKHGEQERDHHTSHSPLTTTTTNTPTRSLPPIYTMATHSLPPPVGFPSHLPPVYQTTNPIVEPKEKRILSVSSLERAVVTMESKSVLHELHVEDAPWFWQCAGQGRSRLGPIQGAGRLGRKGRRSDSSGPGIWLCGSYAYSGIPLLEGCVVSARNVVEQGIRESEGVTRRGISW